MWRWDGRWLAALSWLAAAQIAGCALLVLTALTAPEVRRPPVRWADEPGQGAQFWFNGASRGRVADPLFSERFFGIWLSPQTSEPGLRGKLLGLAE